MRQKRIPPTSFDDDPDKLLTVKDLEALGLMAEGTARNRLSAGTFPFPYVRVGSNVRFRQGDLREFIHAQRSEAR